MGIHWNFSLFSFKRHFIKNLDTHSVEVAIARNQREKKEDYTNKLLGESTEIHS